MTAGLEAKLSLAVGAHVMLRCNIDTKAGLVNSTLGTVLSIMAGHVMVQFDHMTTPYNVAVVKSKFMVMKNFYVYRKQFPLILAYAVTIHKCQGLSLDCAIIDLLRRCSVLEWPMWHFLESDPSLVCTYQLLALNR